MLSLPIIINFHIPEESLLSLILVLKSAMVNESGLNCVKEGLCDCIIPAIPFSAHALKESVFSQDTPETLAYWTPWSR